MKQTIFLDFDGVLNCYVRHPKAPPKWEWPFTWLDAECVGNLASLCALAPEAKIIVSSTWRLSFGVEDFVVMFEELGQAEIASRFVGVTPRTADAHRGAEIHAACVEYGWGNYVILDDDSDMLIQQLPHFVQIDGYKGLTATDVTRALGILKGEL